MPDRCKTGKIHPTLMQKAHMTDKEDRELLGDISTQPRPSAQRRQSVKSKSGEETKTKGQRMQRTQTTTTRRHSMQTMQTVWTHRSKLQPIQQNALLRATFQHKSLQNSHNGQRLQTKQHSGIQSSKQCQNQTGSHECIEPPHGQDRVL